MALTSDKEVTLYNDSVSQWRSLTLNNDQTMTFRLERNMEVTQSADKTPA